MSKLIISFIATVVLYLIIGVAVFVVGWLIEIFGTALITPICLFIFLWICAYCELQE